MEAVVDSGIVGPRSRRDSRRVHTGRIAIQAVVCISFIEQVLHIAENLDVFDFALSADEMKKLFPF